MTPIRPFLPFLSLLSKVGKTEASLLRMARLLSVCRGISNLQIQINLNNNNNRMTQSIDYRALCIQLRTENEILRAEREEAEERETSLKRQLKIITQVHTEDQGLSTDSLQGQIDRLRQEVVSLLGEREQLEIVNRTYLEKIEDLKYHNGELKNLNEKMNHLHSREIEMMRREALQPERLRQLEQRERCLSREKEVLSKQLQEVAKVAEEMEHYYVGEIRKKSDLLRSKDEELFKLTKELEGTKTQRIQHNEIVRQINQQWERQLNNLQQNHEIEVAELSNKIKFLINKIEMQEEGTSKGSKPSLGAISSVSDMIQSKMVQSSSSVDSFRVGPPSMISSKDQNLTRRNTSGAKTPSKYGQKRPLIQRNY